jgi:hypothetical protein
VPSLSLENSADFDDSAVSYRRNAQTMGDLAHWDLILKATGGSSGEPVRPVKAAAAR